jgi:dihydrofolate reductase
MKIIFLVALDRNNLIGCNNSIPWHYPEDIKRFKEITTGYPIVMGRKTWESLTIKPLPNRTNIILTRDLNYTTETSAHIFSDLHQVTEAFSGYEKLFVIGGAEIFKAYIKYADVLDITIINADHYGDVYWKDLNLENWVLQSSRISGILDFRIYVRRDIL